MGKINIVFAKAHENQIQDRGIQKELEDVQRFFDEKDLPFTEGSINFVILRGMYEPLDKSMTVAGVFVNNSRSTIKALKGSMLIKMKEYNEVTFPKVDFQFSPDFLGEINHNEGFIVHVKVPIKNLHSENKLYEARELTGSIEDIQVIN